MDFQSVGNVFRLPTGWKPIVRGDSVLGDLDSPQALRADRPSRKTRFVRSGSRAVLDHKGYIGKVELDDEAGVFHGEVINTRDVITFQGTSVAQLTKAFRDSVDDYLQFCHERNEAPDKPFSGRFVTRIPPELHRQLNLAAAVSGQSLNSWVAEQLQVAVDRVGITKAAGKRIAAKAKSAQKGDRAHG
jgi:predicted HicB family RNase H-like nuclease